MLYLSRVMIFMTSAALSFIPAPSLASGATISMELDQVLSREKNPGDRKAAEDANRKGLAFHTAKKYREAEAEYIRAAKLDPTFGTAYFNIACVRALTGHGETSLMFLKKALELDAALMGPARNDSDLASIRGLKGYREIVSPGRVKISAFQGIAGKSYTLKGCDSPDGERRGKLRLPCVIFAKFTFRDRGVLAVEMGGGGACSYARVTGNGAWSDGKDALVMTYSYQMIQGCDSGGAPVGSVLKTLPVSLRYNTMEEFLEDFETGN